MVEIFKTNVTNKRLANKVLKTLNESLPCHCFNFDMDDCDRILRAQTDGTPVQANKILQLVMEQAVEISLLED